MSYQRFIEPSSLAEQQRLAGLEIHEEDLSAEEKNALYSISQGYGLVRGATQETLEFWRSLYQKGYLKWPKDRRRGILKLTAKGGRALNKALGVEPDPPKKKRPSKKAVDDLIAAFASYLAVQDKADVKMQQQRYDAYRKKLDAMSAKYPYIDMASKAFTSGLEQRARELMKKQPMKYSGTPGASY